MFLAERDSPSKFLCYAFFRALSQALCSEFSLHWVSRYPKLSLFNNSPLGLRGCLIPKCKFIMQRPPSTSVGRCDALASRGAPRGRRCGKIQECNKANLLKRAFGGVCYSVFCKPQNEINIFCKFLLIYMLLISSHNFFKKKLL